MILSVLRLNRSDFEIISKRNQGVFDAYTIHKVVYSLFPKENNQQRNFLYAYKGGDFNEKCILMLSENMPLKSDVGEIESKEIPTEFLEQNYYGFEVQVNPVHKECRTGRIIPIRGSDKDALIKWFTEKTPEYGFEIQEGSLSVGDTDIVSFSKEGKKVVLGKAIFTGKLKVTDRELFIKSFKNGLGKGKAFGFGLLQLVPLTKASADA